jgi:outer membrane murein-binding lipoprotein Lpp
MKIQVISVVLAAVVLMVALAAGCSSSSTNDAQVQALQQNINALNNQLNSVQQALAQQQSKPSTQVYYVTSSQPAYQPNVIRPVPHVVVPWNRQHHPLPPQHPRHPYPPRR